MEFHGDMRRKQNRRPRLSTRGKLVLGTLLLVFGLLLIPRDNTPEDTAPLPAKPLTQTETPAPTPEPEAVAPPAANTVVHEGNFASGRPFFNRITDLGVPAPAVGTLVDLLTPVYDFRRSHPRHRWQLTLVDGQPERFTLEVSPVEIYDVDNLRGEANLTRRKIDTVTERIRVSGEITNSLYRALAHEQDAPALVAKMAQVFAWDIDFYQDPRQGDRFEMLVEKTSIVREEGLEFTGWGSIIAARYSGSRDTYEAVRFTTAKGETGYYDSEGKSLIRDVLRSPLRITRITDRFNKRRFHPVLKRYKPHNGVDYGAAKGTPVMAVANGTVERASRWGGAGIAVVLNHKQRMQTQYFHLSKIAKGVRRGARVKQGQVIGYVGKTGLATGYHLHFGMKKNGKYVNPLNQKFQPGVPINKNDRPAFNARAEHYLAALDAFQQSPAQSPVVQMQSPFNQTPPQHGPRLR